MKTITLAKFKELMAKNSWTHKQIYEKTERTINSNDEIILYGWVQLKSTWKDRSELIITYTQGFKCLEDDKKNIEYFMPEDGAWKIEGVQVVNEENRVLDNFELGEYINNTKFSMIDNHKLYVFLTVLV